MIKKSLIGIAALLTVLAMSQNAHALLGVYADVPLRYTFSDCDKDCEYTPTGAKVGVVLVGLGLGTEQYSISSKNLDVDFSLYDISYLLPIPVINLTIGAGVGAVEAKSGNTTKAAMATQLWGSLGFPIIPLIDIHFGYHQVKTENVDFGGGNKFHLGGTMWSLGMLLNF